MLTGDKNASDHFDILSKILNTGFEDCFPLKKLSKKRAKDKTWEIKSVAIQKISYTGN